MRFFTAAALIFFTAALTLVYAQPHDVKYAYLTKGPVVDRGAPGIGGNLLPGYSGIYNYRESEIKVFFTYQAVPVFESWQIISAGSFELYSIGEDRIFSYDHRGNWTVFIEFTDSDYADIRFLERFISQMIFFVRDGEGFSGSSFPAVIELAGN